jgi:hypothetical protein
MHVCMLSLVQLHTTVQSRITIFYKKFYPNFYFLFRFLFLIRYCCSTWDEQVALGLAADFKFPKEVIKMPLTAAHTL